MYKVNFGLINLVATAGRSNFVNSTPSTDNIIVPLASAIKDDRRDLGLSRLEQATACIERCAKQRNPTHATFCRANPVK